VANRAAQFRAENPGRPVVKRTKGSIHFDLGGGQFRGYFCDPIHYGASFENEIDAAWTVDTGAWQWKMVLNRFNLHARSVLNAGDLLEWLDPTSANTVTFQPLGLNWVDNVTDSRQQIAIAQAVTGVASDNVMTWTNGYGAGRHFRYTTMPERLVKHIIIDAAANLPAPTVSNPYLEIEFIIKKTAGVTLYVDGVAWDNSTKTNTASRIEYRLANQTVVWSFDFPGADDSAGNHIAGIFQLRRQGANRYCTVRIPKSWIDTAVFPIYLDPTLTDGYGGDVQTYKDVFINQDKPTFNYGIHTELALVPFAPYVIKSLIEFDLSGIAATSTCDDATVYFYTSTQYNNANATATIYSVASGNDNWFEGAKNGAAAGVNESTWNNRDEGNAIAWAGSAGLGTSGTDYEAVALGTFAFVQNEVVGTEKSAALTAARIEEWFGGTNNNYGLLMVVDGSNQKRVASSDHATTGYRPKLVVNWTAAGGGSLVISLSKKRFQPLIIR